MIEPFHGVRAVGNAAVHGMEGGRAEALTALEVVRQLAIRFHRTLGRDASFKLGPFRPPRPPPASAAPLAAEIERPRAERDAASSDSERRRVAAEDRAAGRERAGWGAWRPPSKPAAGAIEARSASLLQAAAAAPAAERSAIGQAARAAARATESDEAATRGPIDARSRARGWDAHTRTPRSAAGTRPERGRDSATAGSGWPTETGAADYAPFAGTPCVGGVEAKRRDKDVSGGLKRAERYARGFAPHGPAALAPGAPWVGGEAAYRVAFVFSADGRPHLKHPETASGIRSRDVRRPTDPARAPADRHEPADPTAMPRQDVAAAETTPAAGPIEFGFPLRPHRRRAIEAVEAALAEGRCVIPAAMATGAGATETGIAPLHRPLAAGRLRRVCVVVDSVGGFAGPLRES